MRSANDKVVNVFLYLILTTIALSELFHGPSVKQWHITSQPPSPGPSPRDAAAPAAGAGLAGGGAAQL